MAWLAPSVGLFHDDGVYLVSAQSLAAGHGYMIESLPEPIAQTKYPPLFPALLALFTLVSEQTWWLKLLPLACAFGWLFLTYKLLLKLGAARDGAFLLVVLTAASPDSRFRKHQSAHRAVIRALIDGDAAGAAGRSRARGGRIRRPGNSDAHRRIASDWRLYPYADRPAPLSQRAHIYRRRHAAGGALARMVARACPQPSLLQRRQLCDVEHPHPLAANEKLQVLGANILMLLASPFTLLTGIGSMYAVIATLALLVWSLIKRRQLMPDLFVALYCLMLLSWAGPPHRFVAPIFPLVLWMLWRVYQHVRIQEALAACILIICWR